MIKNKLSKPFLKQRKILLIAAIIPVLLLAASIVLLTQTYSKSPPSFDSLAKEIIEKCKNSKYIPDCYDKLIPLTMTKPVSLSMEDAFIVGKQIQKQVDNYNFCHVLGHKIASYETRKDPDKWKEVISRCPSGTCSNGCIHGAFQEKFRAEYLPPEEVDKIKPELLTICRKRSDWNPSNIEQGSCYHALGHLNMYLTNADIPKSLSLCKELSKTENGLDFTKVCYDGVFMQIFQPLEPEDFALIQGKVPSLETLKTFCQSFGPETYGSCWNESWPLFKDLNTVSGSIKYCRDDILNSADQNRCFTSLFYRSPIPLNFDSNKSLTFCKQFPEDLRGQCFAQTAMRYVQSEFEYIGKAAEFCKSSLPYDPGESCFNELALRAKSNFIPGSPEFEKMCEVLPEKWKTPCLQTTPY